MSVGSKRDLDDTAADLDGASVVGLIEFDTRDGAVDRIGGIRDPDARLREAIGCQDNGTEIPQTAESDDRVLLHHLATCFLVTEKGREFPIGLPTTEFDGFPSFDREDMAVSDREVEKELVAGS
jgi:hypothetical protein